MSDDTRIERRSPTALKEKGPYVLGLGVVALMLYVIGFPVFLLVFFGALAFFVWKVFMSETRSETRRIFEFYLIANEILGDDERRWFGFEVREAVARGEAIVRSMTASPPLVQFALGALYQKLGDHSSALRELTLATDEAADESTIVFPTKDLREYARMLRRIERAPAESPLTASAVRSLERGRKNRGRKMLEFSRDQLAKGAGELVSENNAIPMEERQRPASVLDMQDMPDEKPAKRSKRPRSPDSRQTISEVLHDIYDTNIQ
ncbi:MAG TPA: hypothetical protein VGO43_09245 [Pyrinomonadaceae bacterium]|jgi:hypothetical protein|nr:hypothetical protein [Pyrinomonadaceae bacterium]